MNPVQKFYLLAFEAEQKLVSEVSRGDPELKPYCLSIVTLTLEHPELRADFVAGFQRIVTEPSLGPWEILLPCMHILKWNEIKEWAQRLHTDCIDRHDFRGEPVYRDILEAFSDDWDDFADMYEITKAEVEAVLQANPPKKGD